MQHRDVKSHNIMVTKQDSMIKIIDFGLAAIIHTSGACTKAGTANYGSREKFHGHPYGGDDDMWGVGCVLVELANGQHLKGSLWEVCNILNNTLTCCNMLRCTAALHCNTLAVKRIRTE